MSGLILVDTSAAVALVVADHEAHAEVMDSLGPRQLGLAGHAAFETFSVLTRLPPPARRDAGTVSRLLSDNFPQNRFLNSAQSAQLLQDLAALGIAGGSVYDALVGRTAAVHGLQLATRDRRALDTYRSVGAEVRFIGPSEL